MSVAANLEKIKKEIPSHVTLVAISKTKPVSAIQEAIDAGQLHFGENRVQELTEKHPQFGSNVFWHQVGHLQSNKVKYLAPFVHLIHSVDSAAILGEIQKQALKNNRIISVLLQMHIASEETKFGLNETELYALLNEKEILNYTNIQIQGLMGMATNTSDERIVGNEFRGLRSLFDKLKSEFPNHPRCTWKEVSMGMSGDYKLAIKEGSTMVRVGSAIFG